MHVDQVMRGVPQSERCPGHPKRQGAEKPSLLRRIFPRP